jgi:CHAT domain-containing protein
MLQEYDKRAGSSTNLHYGVLNLIEEFRSRQYELREATRRLYSENNSLAEHRKIRNGAQLITLADLTSQQRSPSRMLERDVERLQALYYSTLKRIRTEYDPEFNPDQPVRPVDYESILKLLDTDIPTAIVQYSLNHDRGCALVITLEGIELIQLPNLNDSQGKQLADAWFTDYYGLQGQSPSDAVAKTWDKSLLELLRLISERAVRPVIEVLRNRDIKRLVVSPNRALHLFPLHACQLADGAYLTDLYEVVYTPSLSILHHCAVRQRTQTNRLLLIQDPTGDLQFAEIEGRRLRLHYPDHVLVDSSSVANKERILQQGNNCHVLHY